MKAGGGVREKGKRDGSKEREPRELMAEIARPYRNEKLGEGRARGTRKASWDSVPGT